MGSTPATLCMHDAINKFFMNTHLSLRGADDGKEDASGCARLKLARKGATATANGSHNDKLSLKCGVSDLTSRSTNAGFLI